MLSALGGELAGFDTAKGAIRFHTDEVQYRRMPQTPFLAEAIGLSEPGSRVAADGTSA